MLESTNRRIYTDVVGETDLITEHTFHNYINTPSLQDQEETQIYGD